MNYRFRNLTRALLFIAALAATALGCVWVGTSDSVRFNDSWNYREMQRLPPLPTITDDTSDSAMRKTEQLIEERNRVFEDLKHNGINSDAWFNPTDPELKSSAAIDALDAATALKQGSPAANVQAYLTARTLHDDNKPREEVESALDPAASDINLKDNVAYLRTAGVYRGNDLVEASRAFSALARKYPHSEKREAALFMTAVATMKTSLAYTPTSGDEAHL